MEGDCVGKKAWNSSPQWRNGEGRRVRKKKGTDRRRKRAQTRMGGCSELQNSRDFRANFFAISIICTLVLVPQNTEDGVKVCCAFQVRSTRTEMSRKVPRWGDLPRRRRDGRREDVHSSSTPQASGDRGQVGQLKSPESPLRGVQSLT